MNDWKFSGHALDGPTLEVRLTSGNNIAATVSLVLGLPRIAITDREVTLWLNGLSLVIKKLDAHIYVDGIIAFFSIEQGRQMWQDITGKPVPAFAPGCPKGCGPMAEHGPAEWQCKKCAAEAVKEAVDAA